MMHENEITYLKTDISQSHEWFGHATITQTKAVAQTIAVIPEQTLETFWVPRCLYKISIRKIVLIFSRIISMIEPKFIYHLVSLTGNAISIVDEVQKRCHLRHSCLFHLLDMLFI